MAEQHTLMGGRLHVYKRDSSRYWQCATFLGGRNWRKSTKEDSLSHAKEIAEDWYLELRGKLRAGVLKEGKAFKEAATQFLREYEVITGGQRSPKHVKRLRDNLRIHLLPYFGNTLLSEITAGMVQEYRIYRAENPYVRPGQDPETVSPPARNTIHQEIVTLRMVLKTANRHGWLSHLPDLSAPYKTTGKIGHRAWFSPDEYRQLYEATRKRATKPSTKRWKWESEQLHDYVLFMANTGLRPDEADRLQYRDVTIVRDPGTKERILEIEVRGKRGVGYCKSTMNAVRPFERLQNRNNPQPQDRIFPKGHRGLLNTILQEEGLKFDRDGNRRTAYSLRHTYICLRLMEGADVYQIAKNCRTSVEMIEKHYAVHLKNTLDAASINIRRTKASRATPRSKNGKGAAPKK
jgi:integrase